MGKYKTKWTRRVSVALVSTTLRPDMSPAFPAQRKSPGLITLTPSTLFFTSLGSLKAKVVIELKDIIGVKKTTSTHGLRIRWRSSATGSEEQEEKFNLVGNRDELFARLVGLEGRRWVRV